MYRAVLEPYYGGPEEDIREVQHVSLTNPLEVPSVQLVCLQTLVI